MKASSDSQFAALLQNTPTIVFCTLCGVFGVYYFEEGIVEGKPLSDTPIFLEFHPAAIGGIILWRCFRSRFTIRPYPVGVGWKFFMFMVHFVILEIAFLGSFYLAESGDYRGYSFMAEAFFSPVTTLPLALLTFWLLRPKRVDPETAA